MKRLQKAGKNTCGEMGIGVKVFHNFGRATMMKSHTVAKIDSKQ